ncbi:hypothetical protein IU501_17455 [Nocardia otitidiscaviarum]|uniref:hypothetical protein n=1 Tax=Nocardia otitidiscaviarum TaxID=1823 RepID=UPI0004A76F41|nr:hypothetical protein [Nocardia otitidiscaviarum]MBF6134784.1 hypothetical protein [Nocardia otitidiscaviarum]MBF6485590.1 hypothetical protein [Nocardia otitidiscaviarum]
MTGGQTNDTHTSWDDWRQDARGGGFNSTTIAFDPAVATTLAGEAATFAAAVENAKTEIASAADLKALNLKGSGADLAGMVNRSATIMADSVLSRHIDILTDIGETFLAATGQYENSEEASRSAFASLRSGATPVAFPEGAATGPSWASSGRGSLKYSDSPQQDYDDRLTDTGEAQSLWERGKKEGDGITMQQSLVDPEAGEMYTWPDFVAQYNHVAGNQITEQLQRFADSWKKAADGLKAQASAFRAAYQGSLQDGASGTNPVGIWASPAAAKARGALDSYLTGIDTLVGNMTSMSDTLAFTKGWMVKLQSLLPQQPLVTAHDPTGSAYEEQLNQMRTVWDNWYGVGAKISSNCLPQPPSAATPITALATPGNPLYGQLTGAPGAPTTDLVDIPFTMDGALAEGIPTSYQEPDGTRVTAIPNADGTLTTARTTVAPDGTITIVSSTDGGPDTVSVATPRNDGSGIIDTVTTMPDGTRQRTVTTPKNDGSIGTQAVGQDGALGVEAVTSRLDDGTIKTEVPDPSTGTTTRMFTAPDGSIQTFVHGTSPDGTSTLLASASSDGTRSVADNFGRVFTTLSDGTTAVTTPLPDGTTVTEFLDGSILPSNPDQPTSPWSVAAFLESAQSSITTDPMVAAGTAATFGENFGAVTSSNIAARAALAAAEANIAHVNGTSYIDGPNPKLLGYAVDAADDSAAKYGLSKAVGSGAKMLGWPALIGTNAYSNWTAWEDGTKSAPAAAASTFGGVAGGWAGAKIGALAGAALCGPGAPVCMGVGAAIGGLVFGLGGSYVAEQPFK